MGSIRKHPDKDAGKGKHTPGQVLFNTPGVSLNETEYLTDFFLIIKTVSSHNPFMFWSTAHYEEECSFSRPKYHEDET